MKTKEVTFRDPIIERVCDQLVSRSNVGYKKYNATKNPSIINKR